MPYVIKPKTVRITFEDTAYDGAQMRCRNPENMDTYWSYQRELTSEDPERIASLIREFGDTMLIDWDISEEAEDGTVTEIPANGDGMMHIPLPLMATVVKRWLEVMAQPSIPLALPSPDGSTSEATSPSS